MLPTFRRKPRRSEGGQCCQPRVSCPLSKPPWLLSVEGRTPGATREPWAWLCSPAVGTLRKCCDMGRAEADFAGG